MTSTMTTQRFRAALGLVTAAALLTLSACGGGSDSGAPPRTPPSASPSESASADASAGPEPDLDAIPDVVAEVNGEEVTKEEFVPIYEAAFRRRPPRPR